MTRKMGMIVLMLGVAIIALSFIDPLNMGNVGASAPGLGGEGDMGDWTTLRIAVMAAGAILAVWGAYGVARKQPEKK
jgi:hypothetical protein